MNVQSVFRSSVLIIIVCTAILPAGCSKNEEPVEEPRFSGLYMKAIMADTLRLKVMDGDNELTNTLFAPGNRITVPATYYEPEHRIRVYNFYGNVLLLDTLISYRATPFYMTFYQGKPGEKLQWIGPPANEALPDPRYLKISVIYTASQLPSAVKVVVENTVSEAGSTYAATDSFLLDKGAFSKYFSGRNIRSAKPRLRFYTTGPERQLVATVAPGEFLRTNFDFSTFLFDRASGSSVFTLTSEKLY